ncbi:unnamed protein product [Prunus armeniaca]|uniref:PUM-HD domain-containing protein n=1 Tax=Prunus armeniaca TaxID=36596 RepID=A0A6J5TT15_PRUAR|nr:unnamed protein product [Prunus armeniaca]
MVLQKMKREREELEKFWNENPKNQPYSNLIHLLHPPHHHHLVSGSPVSRASLQSEFSPSSSFSNGFYSSEDGSPYSTPFEEAKYQTPYMNGLWLDSKPPDSHFNEKMGDDLGLAESFYSMHIGDEQEGGAKRMGLREAQMALKSSGFGVRGRFDGTINESALLGLQKRCTVGNSMGSFLNHMQPNALYSGPSGVKNQMSCISGQRKEEQGDGWYQRKPSLARPYLDEEFFCLQLHGTDCNGGKGLMYPMGSPQLSSVARLNVDNLSHNHSMIKQRTKVNPNSGVPESFKSLKCARELECFCCEDSFIIQGKHLNHTISKGSKSSKGYKKNSCNKAMQTEGEKSSRLDSTLCNGGISGSEWSQSNNISMRSLLTLGSLAEVQGYIYVIAKDQYGCRFLQRMLDDGTCQDVQLIFDKIINHVFELMTNPFGNYLMQKLLDVCNEQQRMQFVLKVTKEPGQLVRISLDTHGTRVVQKLIETVRTGKQISLVKSSLECGFLDLIKDPNGNHVVQRCLDCFSNEDNRFIFDAAARFCVEIATQRHGCCVLQKCIAHARGRHRDKLINEIARNGLLLSQDPYGNYVIQYVMELKIPSAMAKLINQLKGHFVRLSTQKFVADPYANYVVQSALTVTKGPLRASLVEAVKPHTILRTSPYCKRIFSRELLKK